MTTLNSAGEIELASGHCTRLFEEVLSKNSTDPQIEQQSDRFRLWAGNIGARQMGKSSLDYRLREASDLADLVCQLLHGLQTQLLQWRFIQGDSLFSNRIRETIDDLYDLLLIIRQPPPLDRYTKSDDVDLSYFREFDARHVREKYPLLHSREWLVARLADANVRRRQFLKYRELHNQKLSRVSEASKNSQIDIVETGVAFQLQQGVVAATKSVSPHSDPGQSNKASTMPDTVATPFIPKVNAYIVDEFDDAQSATTFASHLGDPGGTKLQLPRRPTASLHGNVFVCPVCYFPEQVGNDEGWKRHVLHDLQPYVCTFEHCPSTLFASRHAWFDHELVAHRKEWTCGVCNGHTKSASAFLEHAQSMHQRTFPEKLVSKILQQNERAQTKYKANDCPFCDNWRLKHDDKNVPEDELFVTVKQFRQHVGRHMEELALFVLPVDLGDDFQSEKAAGEAESFNSPPSMSRANEFDNPDDSLARLTEKILNAHDQGDLEEVRNLIQGTDVFPVIDIKGEGGETLLMMLSRFNVSAEILYLAVKAGADISAKDSCGRTALLHYFSKISGPKADLLAALHLLSGLSGKFRQIVDIEAADSAQDGFRALHWIAWFGLSEVCREILQLGADIEAGDREGRTPLRIAMMSEQKEVALLLLDMGADVGEIYPMDLHPEMRSLLGWASSNDRLHVGKLVVHKNGMRQEKVGEGILRRVSKVIRVDSPYIFEVEDLTTKDISAWTSKVNLYRGYSTDFIPLRPEDGNDENPISPGDQVLARYPDTRLFLSGSCRSVNDQSVTIGFFIDEQGSSRDIDARYVIPWKVRFSEDARKREPPLSFCFTIRSIRPDYSMQSRQLGPPPIPLWIPPTNMQAFELDASIGPYQWHNGLVRPIHSAEQHYWKYYSTTSIFWCHDRQAFLHIPYDCTKTNVSDERDGLESDIPLTWRRITFHRTSDHDNRLLSLLGYRYDGNELGARASPAWMPELLPEVYQHQGPQRGAGTAQLAGSLSLLISLVAFSAPPDKMLEVMQDSFRHTGPDWTPHGRLGQGRTFERGLVVDIGYDSRMGCDKEYLRSWEEGKYGPIIT